MPEFTPAQVAGAPVVDEINPAERGGAPSDGNGPPAPPFVSKLSAAETELLAVADKVIAAFRYLAAQIPSALPLHGLAAEVEAAVARARSVDKP